MNKELRKIRDNKLNEMAETVHNFEMLERDAIKSGKKTVMNINDKEVVIYDDAIKFYRERNAYIKDSLDYLFANYKINKSEIIRKLNYMMKNELNVDMWLKLSTLKVAVKNI